MTQFEVRRTLECIESSPEAPFRKARALLRLRRILHRQADLVAGTYEQTLHTRDQGNIATLRRLKNQNEELSESIREAAARILQNSA
mgnify:CR=1 FL=1